MWRLPVGQADAIVSCCRAVCVLSEAYVHACQRRLHLLLRLLPSPPLPALPLISLLVCWPAVCHPALLCPACSLEHGTPDAVFPNNWFSTHPAGEAAGGCQQDTLVFYPMKCPNRWVCWVKH
jgi:hypothetical protein